jgi:hypothetical protein
MTQEAFYTRQNRAAWRRKLFSPDKTAPRGAGSFLHPTKPRRVAQEAFYTRQNRAAWRRKLLTKQKKLPRGGGAFLRQLG